MWRVVAKYNEAQSIIRNNDKEKELDERDIKRKKEENIKGSNQNTVICLTLIKDTYAAMGNQSHPFLRGYTPEKWHWTSS